MFLSAFLAASCVGSCEAYAGSAGSADGKSTSKSLSAAVWNVQALFDGSDAGTEYDDYRAASGWNEPKYLARLAAFSDALSSVWPKGPDLLALVEVENRAAIDRFADEYFTKAGYGYSFFSGLPGYALGLGLLSRYPLTRALSHSASTDGGAQPRPIAEVWLEPEGSPLVVFICHWKSKSGGDAETEALRRDAARVILRRVKAIREADPAMPVVVMGDLNENYDEFARQGEAAVCALLPDTAEAAKLAGFGEAEMTLEEFNARPQQDFLIISREKPPRSVYFYSAEGVFYSPWAKEMGAGSYVYGGDWETIDHFLLSPAFFDNSGWDFRDAAVIDSEPFVNSKGEPALDNPRTGSGLSDHLPLLLTLTLRVNEQLAMSNE
jgi:endonuclease/exonuclease/phosphatase family metal-dependent hydrolase